MRTPKAIKNRYDKAIVDLQMNDMHSNWNEIIDECEGKYFRAMKVLQSDLESAISQNWTTCRGASMFYKSILETLTTKQQ
jgi:retron-type reverse transcriptase